MKHGPPVINGYDSERIPWQVRDSFATGLFPLSKVTLKADQRPPVNGTFEWVLQQEGLSGHVSGAIYTDGSRRFDLHPDTMRLGWSLVVLNRHNHVVAIARGATPDFVDDIPGAEAWAILQAAAIAVPGSTFRSVCKPCIDSIHAGCSWACAANRPLARIYRQLFPHIDDVPVANFVWMPSHTSTVDVERLRLSNGQLLTHADRRANALADHHAKIAAATFAAPQAVYDKLLWQAEVVKDAARWLGRVTWAASNDNPSGGRDSVASRTAANLIRGRRSCKGAVRSEQDRAPSRTAKSRRDLTGQQRVDEWTSRVEAEGSAARHLLMMSGPVVWCNVCGAFGSQRGCGLAHACPGPAQVSGTGGRAQQLRRLRSGFHPKDRNRLPAAVPQSEWSADELSQVQKFLAAAPWLLESQEPDESRSCGDQPGSEALREGLDSGDNIESRDHAAEVLRHTEFGRSCLKARAHACVAPTSRRTAAQVQFDELLSRVRKREHCTANAPHCDEPVSAETGKRLKPATRRLEGSSGCEGDGGAARSSAKPDPTGIVRSRCHDDANSEVGDATKLEARNVSKRQTSDERGREPNQPTQHTQIDLTQELADIINNDTSDHDVEVGGNGSKGTARVVVHSEGYGGAARSSAKPDPLLQFNKCKAAEPIRATAEERLELRRLRHRQADSGGHPIGDSDSESQPDEWAVLDLRNWVQSGRPSVVIQGKPSHGGWDHPWVTYESVIGNAPNEHGDVSYTEGDGGCVLSDDGDDVCMVARLRVPVQVVQTRVVAQAVEEAEPVHLSDSVDSALVAAFANLPPAESWVQCGYEGEDATGSAVAHEEDATEGSTAAVPLRVPALPTISEAVLVQLNSVLPPPSVSPPGCKRSWGHGADSGGNPSKRARHSGLSANGLGVYRPMHRPIGRTTEPLLVDGAHGPTGSNTRSAPCGADRAASTATLGSG